MNDFRLTATTTDEQIHQASKEDLICALFTGAHSILRQIKRRKWSKLKAIEEAMEQRDRLQGKVRTRANDLKVGDRILDDRGDTHEIRRIDRLGIAKITFDTDRGTLWNDPYDFRIKIS